MVKFFWEGEKMVPYCWSGEKMWLRFLFRLFLVKENGNTFFFWEAESGNAFHHGKIVTLSFARKKRSLFM